MSTLNSDLVSTYGNRLRVRVCGFYIENHKLLLVKHSYLGPHREFWAPPGGGMEYGETSCKTLVREFKEEVGLSPTQFHFAFTHEFIDLPLQAIELYYTVTAADGIVKKGLDPEMDVDRQLIQEVRFMTLEEITSIPQHSKHHVLHAIESLDELTNLKGYSIYNPRGI